MARITSVEEMKRKKLKRACKTVDPVVITVAVLFLQLTAIVFDYIMHQTITGFSFILPLIIGMVEIGNEITRRLFRK